MDKQRLMELAGVPAGKQINEYGETFDIDDISRDIANKLSTYWALYTRDDEINQKLVKKVVKQETKNVMKMINQRVKERLQRGEDSGPQGNLDIF